PPYPSANAAASRRGNRYGHRAPPDWHHGIAGRSHWYAIRNDGDGPDRSGVLHRRRADSVSLSAAARFAAFHFVTERHTVTDGKLVLHHDVPLSGSSPLKISPGTVAP